jgi:hypothetical protein
MRDGAVHKALGAPANKTATFKLVRVKTARSRSCYVAETAHITLSARASYATPEEAEAYSQNAIKYMGKARR